MKKRNAFSFGMILSLCALTACVTSCKSAPQGAPVHPLDLLNADSSFYLKMPQKTDSVLVTRLIQSSVAGIREEDASAIASRADCVYAGLERRKNETIIQAAVSGSVPGSGVTKLLRRDKSWESASVFEKTVGGDPSEYSYFTQTASGMQVAFPSANIACIGSTVPSMLAAYHSHAFLGDTSHAVPDAVYEWLTGDDSQIRFYAVKPQSFLTVLTGANLNLKLAYVRGYMITDTQHDDQYIMTIEFEFNDERMIKAGEGLLSLAFGLTSSQTQLTTPTHLTVSNIRINKKQLYKLFIL